MSGPIVGFVGFGEAAQNFAAHLSSQGITDIPVFCQGRTNAPPYSDSFRSTASAHGARLVDDIDTVMRIAEIVFSAVVVGSAVSVGLGIADRVRGGQLIVDINASTPRAKRTVAERVLARGGSFVDANLMGAVSIYGAAVPLYSSGDGVDRFAQTFRPLGFVVDVAGPIPGAAAAVKMLRSVVTKGMEALLIEALTAATIAGVRKEAMRGICEPMDATTYSKFVDMCVRTDVLHADRRAIEMEGVAEGLREFGLEPIMTDATVARLRASAALNLRESFASRQGYDADNVLDAYALKMVGKTV